MTERDRQPLRITPARSVALIERAAKAWSASGGVELPDSTSSVKRRLGLAYVVLRGRSGLLAVYRVRQIGDGELMLRRLTRWPASLTDSD